MDALVIPIILHIVRISSDTNIDALSLTIIRGHPYLQMISFISKSAITVDVGELGVAKASTHFVPASVNTTMYLLPILVVVRGPATSTCTRSNGPATSYGNIGFLFILGGEVCVMQLGYDRTYVSHDLYMP